MYGFKRKFTLRSTEFCIHHSCHELGGISNIPIYKNIFCSTGKLRKIVRDDRNADERPAPEEQATSAGKGYQCMGQYIRAISPKRKPLSGALTPAEKSRNEKRARHRVIAESYFGWKTVL